MSRKGSAVEIMRVDLYPLSIVCKQVDKNSGFCQRISVSLPSTNWSYAYNHKIVVVKG